jgi:lipoate-protein ligase A
VYFHGTDVSDVMFTLWSFSILRYFCNASLTLEQQVSGTAAKLGRPNAYHHCTLLVDVDKVKLKHALHKHHVSTTFVLSEHKIACKVFMMVQ